MSIYKRGREGDARQGAQRPWPAWLLSLHIGLVVPDSLVNETHSD